MPRNLLPHRMGRVRQNPQEPTEGQGMSFHLSVADNVGFLLELHNETHTHSVAWRDCPHSPCSRLEPGFREVWSK